MTRPKLEKDSNAFSLHSHNSREKNWRGYYKKRNNGSVAGQEWKRQYNNTKCVDTAQVTPVAIRALLWRPRDEKLAQGTKPVEKKQASCCEWETLLGIGTFRSVSL